MKIIQDRIKQAHEKGAKEILLTIDEAEQVAVELSRVNRTSSTAQFRATKDANDRTDEANSKS